MLNSIFIQTEHCILLFLHCFDSVTACDTRKLHQYNTLKAQGHHPRAKIDCTMPGTVLTSVGMHSRVPTTPSEV